MVKPCKEHTRIYLGGEFVWCKCCGAIHRVENVNEENDTSDDVGEWVVPNKDLNKEKFLKLVAIEEEGPKFKIIEGGLVN